MDQTDEFAASLLIARQAASDKPEKLGKIKIGISPVPLPLETR